MSAVQDWHDTAIHDPKTFDAMNAKSLVDYSFRIACSAHLATACWMIAWLSVRLYRKMRLNKITNL
jgi:hypothetical protein